MGLFDSIFKRQEFIEWQNAVIDTPKAELVFKRDELEKITYSQVQNSIRIIQDCGRILQETIDADTFFMRLNLMREHIESLLRLEPFFQFVPSINMNVSPTQLMQTYEFERSMIISAFLDRSSLAVEEKAAGMKTDRGRKNQIKKYFEALFPYQYWFSVPDIKKYLLPLYTQYGQDIQFDTENTEGAKLLLKDLNRYNK